MIRGITWTHIQSIWNHSGPSEVPFFCCFLQQIGSKYTFPYIQQTKNFDLKIDIFLIFMFINFSITDYTKYKNFKFGFAHEKKNITQDTLPKFQEFPHYCPVKFKFSNVANRQTVYKTGIIQQEKIKISPFWLTIFNPKCLNAKILAIF